VRSSTRSRLIAALAGVAEIALIFGLTIALSAPQYYDRILIFGFVALYLNSRYFGREHAAIVLALIVAGYASLIQMSIARGAPLQWPEEIWSIAAFVLASLVLLIEYGSLRNRLETIVRLFGRAEEGDFAEAYDEEADTRRDEIAQVGRAYNRVRGQLASMVLTDPLTGCVNRRGFDQALAREIARAGRAGSELALLALDIDHFKAVNDTLGHLAGDAVLREVGKLLLRAARGGDVVARTGGEEFALILPDTSASGAYQLASRLCEAIRAHRFSNGERGVVLTASIGVVATDASWREDMSNVAEILKGRSDEALYAAKRGGRDRVRVWSPQDEQIPLGSLIL
jgi:diguanylate cyclase (GGDEF)-like protein